jgi:hypothetical protein
LWSKKIPLPQRPESRFHRATSVLREIAGSEVSRAIHVQFHDWPHITEVMRERGGDEYLLEAFERDEFLSGFVSVSWQSAGRYEQLTFDILIEDHFGPDNPRWLEVYFPDPRPRRYIADDGWVLRIVAEDDHFSVLDMATAAIHSKLGGKIYDGQ